MSYTVRFRLPIDHDDVERTFVTVDARTPVEAIVELAAADPDNQHIIIDVSKETNK